MSKPAPSKLDSEQILPAAFDDSTGTLRTSATLVASGETQIIVSNTDDSIAIGTDSNLFTGTSVDSKFGLDVNVIGSSNRLFSKPYDTITVTYPSPTQEIYVSRIGGISGTPQQTITLNYVDSTKNQMLNVSRT